jgi:ubiquinone/menaquinone biosynthesis C-methylase UbiE
VAQFLHPSANPAVPGGMTIGTPRRYAFITGTLFFGRRRAAMAALARAAGVGPGQHVLDVGCGDGLLTAVAAAAVGPEGHAVGLDAAPEMVAWAQKRHPEAKFVAGSADAIPAPDGHFDAVLSSFVIHHLAPESREAAVREMARVLRPGGRLLLAEIAAPRSGLTGLIARLHGLDRMASRAPALPPLLEQAGLATDGEHANGPWIRYAVGTRSKS